ncbi:folate-binding protein YgfZ [Arcanobacterium sp. S3PF19]|uniref:CAF17-like 4Fe-4S cluster assembly/insertion protein YgfZ n=1 Tax=Arcanobacterium sp. S3PF19 TaxID=1219585 RepID=UPI00069241FA|nr:folate-binding protein YgfZ [Arcanobacterium sp. S3PF19]
MTRAVIDEQTGLPAHYGNPFREQEDILQRGALVDLSYMEIVCVQGPDRAKWLHSLGTCAFEQLKQGETGQMLILDPNGYIAHSALATDDGTQTWLLTDSGRGRALADFLESMKFMMRVGVSMPSLHVFACLGGRGRLPARIAAEAKQIWEDPWPHTSVFGADYGLKDGDHPGLERNAVFCALSGSSLPAEGEVCRAGLTAWEALRVRHLRPRLNSEVSNRRVLPHELDLLRCAVHLSKGCYCGQETVAKIVNLGKPPRRLVFLYLEGPEGDLPAAGTPVCCGKRKIGVLTSPVRDFEQGPTALALIRRGISPDAQLETGGFAAAQMQIVSADGKSSVSPAQRPGAGLLRIDRRGDTSLKQNRFTAGI